MSAPCQNGGENHDFIRPDPDCRQPLDGRIRRLDLQGAVQMCIRDRDAEDAALLAIRRTVCRTMNQCYGAATPAQVAAVEAGIKYGWSDRRANPALYDADGAFCG